MGRGVVESRRTRHGQSVKGDLIGVVAVLEESLGTGRSGSNRGPRGPYTDERARRAKERPAPECAVVLVTSGTFGGRGMA